VLQQDVFSFTFVHHSHFTNSLYNQIWIGIVYKKRAKSILEPGGRYFEFIFLSSFANYLKKKKTEMKWRVGHSFF